MAGIITGVKVIKAIISKISVINMEKGNTAFKKNNVKCKMKEEDKGDKTEDEKKAVDGKRQKDEN